MAYNTGGMLAETGLNVGKLIGGGFADLGAGIGTGVGGMMTRRRERQAEQSAQEQFQQILSDNQNNPAVLRTKGQEMMVSRDPNRQRIGKMLMDEAVRLTAVQTKAKEEKLADRTGRGKGELMALANNPKFDVMNQKMQSGYLGMANAFGVSREDAMRIALEALENRKGKDGDFRKTGETTIRDEEGNEFIEFSIQNINNPDSDPITKTVPVGSSPDQPVGNTQIISSTTGASAFDKPKIAGDVTKAEEFSKSQQSALDNLPKIEIAIENAEKSLSLLGKIKTGGFSTAIVRSAQQFLGTEPKDQAEFNLLAGKTVLDNLSNFAGAISEGERIYLERLYQSLERSGGANQAILENLLQEAQFLLADAKSKANASSYKNYLDTRPTYSSVINQQNDDGPEKVNFNDLK
tara:strand:+ start:58 stop:1278 length:1221 start_codon:yes stop_codon:yes gene_type:complete